MTARGMSASMLTAIAAESVEICHLLLMDFSTPVYLTDARRDIVYGGNTYLASGNFVSVAAVKEEVELRVGFVNVMLSGVNSANISVALSENFVDKNVLLYRAAIDSSGDLIASPVLIFDGRIDEFVVNEDPDSGTASLAWKVASHLADFEKVAGRRTNNEDQQLYYSGDLGLDHASEIIADIKWGRV